MIAKSKFLFISIDLAHQSLLSALKLRMHQKKRVGGALCLRQGLELVSFFHQQLECGFSLTLWFNYHTASPKLFPLNSMV